MITESSSNSSENSAANESTQKFVGFFNETPGHSTNPSKSGAENDSIGKILQHKRESMKMEIRDVSHRLKVKISDLKALENDDLTSITKHLYIPGLITSYARALKIDEKLIEGKIRKLPIRSNTEIKDHQLINIGEESDLTPNKDLTVNALLVSILLILILLSFYHSYEKRDSIINNQKLIEEMENTQAL